MARGLPKLSKLSGIELPTNSDSAVNERERPFTGRKESGIELPVDSDSAVEERVRPDSGVLTSPLSARFSCLESCNI